MKNTVVIGAGNVLMSDEGVGVHLVRRMGGEFMEPGADAEFVDAGAAGMRLLHLIAGRARAIIVDCALMGEKPGSMRVFGPEDVKSCKALAGLSLHEGDLLSVLEVSRRLDECPRDVVICGIEPASVGPGMELSPVLSDRMDEYVASIRRLVSAGAGSRRQGGGCTSSQ